MATDNASTEDVDNAADDGLSEYAAEVRTFQLAFAHELHRLGDIADACNVFDRVLNEAGLPARERYTSDRDRHGYSQTPYRGDDILAPIETPEEAQRWALNASHVLTAATDSYGYRQVYDADHGRDVRLNDILEFFGMPTKRTFPVKVTGTFELTFDVNGWDDANLIDNVNVYDIGSRLADAVGRGDRSVQWKVERNDS